MQEKNWDEAITQISQSNPQNPYNLALIGESYLGKGDTARAEEIFAKAANYNLVNSLVQSMARQRVAKIRKEQGLRPPNPDRKYQPILQIDDPSAWWVVFSFPADYVIDFETVIRIFRHMAKYSNDNFAIHWQSPRPWLTRAALAF